MEFESTEKLQMVYETLKNIETAIIRLQERTVQIHTVDDFLLSPFGMEKLDAACMVIIALGEAVKTLDKLTNKELLPTYPSIDWKKVMGARDIMAHWKSRACLTPEGKAMLTPENFFILTPLKS